MHPEVARPQSSYRSRFALGVAFFLALLALFAFAARTAQAAPVSADAVLLENPEQLWNDEFNPKAMEAAFGTNWEVQKFPDVQADESAGGLFAPHVRFIWIEGSDGSTLEAKAFVAAHEAALKAFVARGGGLFINSATNQEEFIEYDGRSVGRSTGETSDEVVALVPSHPIFHGPATPNATSFTGTSFAHGGVIGPNLRPLIEGTDSSEVVLAEYSSGAGHVMIGSMTVVEFQEPEDAAKSLRTNILSYLTPPPSVPALGPPPPPPAADTTSPTVKLNGLPKSCVDGGFRFRVKVSDSGGVGIVRVKLGGKLLRKADGKGKSSKLVKVRIPDKKLDHPGRYRVTVIARDISGNVTRKSSAFRVCD
jgi:hypothetical protein